MTEPKKVKARVIVEVVGKPEEHVKKALGIVIDKIKTQKGLKILTEKSYKPKHVEPFFSTFAEIDIEFADPNLIVGFCYDFMPSSLDILEPDNIVLNSKELAGILNDLLTRLHSVNMSVANYSAENEILNRNAKALLKNLVMHALEKPKTIEELSKIAGIKAKELEPFVEDYVKKGKIKKTKNKYTLTKSLY